MWYVNTHICGTVSTIYVHNCTYMCYYDEHIRAFPYHIYALRWIWYMFTYAHICVRFWAYMWCCVAHIRVKPSDIYVAFCTYMLYRIRIYVWRLNTYMCIFHAYICWFPLIYVVQYMLVFVDICCKYMLKKSTYMCIIVDICGNDICWF